MTEKVSLPDGAWAVLRDPAKVTERARRPLTKLRNRLLGSDVGGALVGADSGMAPEDALKLIRPVMGSDDFDLLGRIDDVLVSVLVESWSFEADVSEDSVLDLPGDARAALIAACKPLMGPLLGETTDAEVTDPASPTEPVSGSDRL